MNGKLKENADADVEDRDFEDTEELSVAAASNTDNVGDASVEINVEELISEVEAAGLPTDHFQNGTPRKRLEELLEEKRMSKEISDFEDFDLD